MRTRKLALKIEALSKSTIKPTKYAGMLYAVYGKKEIMPAVWFDEVVLIEFESELFYALKEYDNYLSHIYGDYMQLPPEDNRHSPHDVNKVYWK